MAASRALMAVTLGSRRLMARSLAVPKTLAMTVLITWGFLRERVAGRRMGEVVRSEEGAG